jgi:hypothetical protein
MILLELYNLEESSGYSLQGSFTHDLTKSKVWLMSELAKVQQDFSTIYVLGSWFGNLALYMTLDPMIRAKKIINVDVNPEWMAQSQRMLDHVGADNVEHMLRDANRLDYRQLGSNGAVINTGLTDIDGRAWFDRIPSGTVVVMQARDQNSGNQFSSADDILEKFPLSQVSFSGSLQLQDPETPYRRFMVIGTK